MSINYTVSTKISVPIDTGLLDRFLNLTCATDLLQLYRKTNNISKEITESMAAFEAIGKWLAREKFFTNFKELSSKKIRCLVVGDGATPRTGALFAYRTKWDIVSVDPQMVDKDFSNIKHLRTIGTKIEDCNPWESSTDLGVLIHVHSHADLNIGVAKLQAKRVIAVAIPCCVAQTIHGHKHDFYRRHYGILSDKNEIYLWDFLTKKED